MTTSSHNEQQASLITQLINHWELLQFSTTQIDTHKTILASAGITSSFNFRQLQKHRKDTLRELYRCLLDVHTDSDFFRTFVTQLLEVSLQEKFFHDIDTYNQKLNKLLNE